MNSRMARPVLVLTAGELEHQAVGAHLTGLRRHAHPAGTFFAAGHLPGGEGEIILARTGAGGAGPAALAERAMSTFGPLALLFAGLAGAIGDDVRLGDVVVATRVYARNGGNQDGAGVVRAWDAPHELEQHAQRITLARSWARFLPAAAPGRLPGVHFRPIAAGAALLAPRAGPAGRLRDTCDDAVAIDLDGAGIAQASRFSRSLPALAVRGISDRADGGEDPSRTAGWRPRAAAHAAAFALALAAELIAHDRGPGVARPVPPVPERPGPPPVLADPPWPPDGW